MLRPVLHTSLLALAAVVGGLALAAEPAHAQTANDPRAFCAYRAYGMPDLFYNYYVPPNCGGVGAQLYVAPMPVPAHVGHTYYTYQPLLPHEHMYAHHRTYHRYYDGGRGLNRTHVVWTHSPVNLVREAAQHLWLAR